MRFREAVKSLRKRNASKCECMDAKTFQAFGEEAIKAMRKICNINVAENGLVNDAILLHKKGYARDQLMFPSTKSF